MTTYNYLKLTGCLLIASCVSFGAAAQQANPAPENTDATAGYVVSQNNSPASIERIRVENLHFSHSENASGIQLDPIGYYSEASLGFDREKGSLKRVQEGADNTAYSFSTDGGGHLAGLRDMYVWGRFSYTRKNLKDAQYNATLFDPLRGTLSVGAHADVAVFDVAHPYHIAPASFRSKGTVNVNEVAGVFGGGGHVLASGCMLFGDLEEIVDKISYAVRQRLPQ